MDGELARGGFNAEVLATIPPMLERVAAAGDIAGFVTLIWRKGEIAQVNAVGRRDVEADLPMTRETIFRIASMTKPMTSALALMLLEEGKLRLEDPISRWAPEFASPMVLAGSEPHEVVPAAREITVEDLLTQRSGIAYDFTASPELAKAYRASLGDLFAAPPAPDAWMKALGALPLATQPGSVFQYGHSTDVLGFIIGRIEDKPFRQVMTERLLAPLGMSDTDFFCPPEKRGRMAKLYRIDPEADRLQDISSPHWDEAPDFAAGGHGLFSTADDYLKFARMLLGGGELDGRRYLKAETVATMSANRLTAEQRAVPFFGLPFWLGQGFGLGVSTITDPEKQAWMGQGSEGSFGWPGIYGTWWQADPKEEMILLYMIQHSQPLGAEAMAQIAMGQRMGGRAALPVFQKTAYAAIAG